MRKPLKPYRRIHIAALLATGVCMAVFIYWLFCLPAKLFDTPASTVLHDRNGQLMGARIADDGQWRFPACDTVPARFAACLISFEDRRFYAHPGVDLRALARATFQNASQRRRVSGGSTLTMQLMRMSRNKPRRGISDKLIEMMAATRAEIRYSKDAMLAMYASHAPFGGNVVGLDAAAWRYFGKPPHQMSWAEAATLAVLPNAPSLVYPGKNQELLLQKRNRLLGYLYESGQIDSLTLHLSRAEPPPGKPLLLPHYAPHLTERLIAGGGKGTVIETTIDLHLQQKIAALVDRQVEMLSRNHVFNIAILVAEVESGAVRAYVGNATQGGASRYEHNDMVRTPRSSGSILKPFLYGQMLSRGQITPQQLIPDIPTQYAGFSPSNFDESYSGAVAADAALARSLNIPAVRMLRDYGVPVWHADLKNMGLTTLNAPAAHYGLSLVLGGAETTLWDLASIYRNTAAQVRWPEGYASLQSLHCHATEPVTIPATWPMHPGAAWAVTESLSTLRRPGTEAHWQYFAGRPSIAWKTGTSYGFRDAWAVGYTAEYVVAVWVGNATGEGRPGITGMGAAAPVLLSVFGMLPSGKWFTPPEGYVAAEYMCAHSGMKASQHCEKNALQTIPKSCVNTKPCTYCKVAHVTPDGSKRVHAECHPTSAMVSRSYFVLPPLQEYFFRKGHPGYKPLPPWAPACSPDADDTPMRLIYPRETANIFPPRELDGRRQAVHFKAAHRDGRSVIYWYLNDAYITETNAIHELDVHLNAGTHQLTLVDEDGFRLVKKLVVSY